NRPEYFSTSLIQAKQHSHDPDGKEAIPGNKRSHMGSGPVFHFHLRVERRVIAVLPKRLAAVRIHTDDNILIHLPCFPGDAAIHGVEFALLYSNRGITVAEVTGPEPARSRSRPGICQSLRVGREVPARPSPLRPVWRRRGLCCWDARRA